MSKTPISAIAVFDKKPILGTVRFTEDLKTEDLKNDCVIIDIDIKGLKKGSHGFHIHECGDMSDQCESMCAHFNPYGKSHGGPNDRDRHIGDLGNLDVGGDGCVKKRITDSLIKLRGTKANIIGRGLIIHADEDDLGKGGQPDSLTTGHSGKRIACAVIGYAKPI